MMSDSIQSGTSMISLITACVVCEVGLYCSRIIGPTCILFSIVTYGHLSSDASHADQWNQEECSKAHTHSETQTDRTTVTWNSDVYNTDVFEPGLWSLPGRRERLVLRRSTTHANFDGGRHERPVTEAGRWMIADVGVGRQRHRRLTVGGGRPVSAGKTHVRDPDEPNCSGTFSFLDEIDSGVNVLCTDVTIVEIAATLLPRSPAVAAVRISWSYFLIYSFKRKSALNACMLVLMHDFCKIITRRSFGALRVCVGVESCKIVFLGGTSCLLVRTLLLQDVSFSHNTQKLSQ